MKKRHVLILALTCIGIFLLVYSIHFNYKYPLHVDEWHHISETLKIRNGEYIMGVNMFRVGFDLFLLPFSYLFDLVKLYQFLPAIWAVLSALTLFFIVKYKTKSYWIAVASMIFFTSLKSNVNIGGLWFFIPSVFCIPLIYLYVFFFSEGIEKQNKRYILISLGIMLATIFAHTSSFLFAIPILAIYSLFYFEYIKKEWRFFSTFSIIPVIGLLFYSLVKKIDILSAIKEIFFRLQFKYGYSPLELNNSPLEIYSLIGYTLAILGLYHILKNKKTKNYLIYILWPVLTLTSVVIFKIFGISFLAPYQRTFYYFALSLPFLSALGLFYLLKAKDIFVSNIRKIKDKKTWKKYLEIILFIIIIILAFFQYNNIPGNVKIYHLIDDNDYNALLFLKNQSLGKVVSSPSIGSATYAVSGQKALGAIFFYGNKVKTKDFMSSSNCTVQNSMIKQLNVSYVLLEKPSICNWTLIYNNTDVIYNVRNISNPPPKIKTKK